MLWSRPIGVDRRMAHYLTVASDGFTSTADRFDRVFGPCEWARLHDGNLLLFLQNDKYVELQQRFGLNSSEWLTEGAIGCVWEDERFDA